MRKGRLGRGLEALLGSTGESSVSFRVLSIDSLEPGRFQPRLNADEELDELVESVKKHGILQPIVVTEDGGKFSIVAGERRWMAAKRAGLKEVPVVVGSWDERDIAILSLVENVQRKGLNPVEEALYYRRLTKEFGLTQEEIASLTGKSRAHIANVMRVLRLPDEVISALEKGEITLGHAKALLSLPNRDLMLEAFKEVVNNSLSVRDTEELVRAMRKRDVQESKGMLSKYGLKMRVIHGKRTSKLVLTGDRRDIERLLADLSS